MFDNLTEKLSNIFKNLTSKGNLNKSDIDSSMREIKIALLEADVNYLVVKDFVDRLSSKILGTQITKSLTPSQMVIKIVNEELILLLGNDAEDIKFKSKGINSILLCGLQGSGKTTQSVKLAIYLRKKKFNPLLVACDVYRPAAIKQLQILAKSVDIAVYFEENNNDVVEIAQKSYIFASENGYNLIIFDTAGRLQIDEKLMKELESIKIALNPSEIFLVVDSMSGQDAVNVAVEFNRRLDITGVILTKFDGDSRGGAALSIKTVTKKPIKFIGTGEKVNNFEVFHPKRLASRILGMGDILSLIENAEEQLDKEDVTNLSKRLKQNKFDFNDFLTMMNQIKKLGPLKSIIEKLPNTGNFTNLNFDDKMLKKSEAIVLSMTIRERKRSDLLDFSRKKRISSGSGCKLEEINNFLRRFDDSLKLIKQFSGRDFGMFSRFFK